MDYDKSNLNRSIGVIEGKLDLILKHLEKINGNIEKHENQLNSLEKENSKVKGVSAGIAATVSISITIVIYILSNR